MEYQEGFALHSQNRHLIGCELTRMLFCSFVLIVIKFQHDDATDRSVTNYYDFSTKIKIYHHQ